MMKKTMIVLAALLGVWSAYMPQPGWANAAPATPEAAFFTSILDMPLMPGLSELTDQTVTFDKPEGRIVEAVAEIETASFEDVGSYYEATLPHLGWQKTQDGSFVRGQEQLRLGFETIEGQRFLRVMLSPRQ